MSHRAQRLKSAWGAPRFHARVSALCVIFCKQMASKTLITPEQYLAMHFEREPEYVRGELVERSLPTKPHSRVQHRLSLLLDRIGDCYPELRVKLADDLYRVPDFAVYPSEPEGEPTSVPAFIAIEIKSPDDRRPAVERKLDEYAAWGVAHIWFIDPEDKKLFVFDHGLKETASLDLPQFNLIIQPADLFD